MIKRRIATFFFLVILPCIAAKADEHRIILIGNSITKGTGSSDGLGFRDELYYRLKAIGYPFRFVGDTGAEPLMGHFQGGAYTKNFFPGSGGDGSFDVGPAMDAKKPDIAVIHLGSNDFWLGLQAAPYTEDGGYTFTKNISGRLGRLIDYLVDWHDGTRGTELETIFLCMIIPKAWRHANGIKALNEEIQQMVEDMNNGLVTPVPPGIVHVVDQYTTFNTGTMLSDDGTHPNYVGYRHMADVFREAFRTLPMRLIALSGDRQNALPNTELDTTLSVLVTDDYGNIASPTEVDFSVVDGDAQLLSSSVVITDTSGIASVRVKTGFSDSSTVVAHAGGLIDSLVTFKVFIRPYVQADGIVQYFSGPVPVDDVAIFWVEADSAVALTGTNGSFEIGYLPRHEGITLVPEKEGQANWTQSPVLSWDAALVARHVVGLDSLSDSQKLAADVDGDTVVTMGDALLIARYAVGLSDTQSVAGTWKFNPSFMTWDSLNSDLQQLQFEAILTGDVHGGWSETGQNPETLQVPASYNHDRNRAVFADTVVLPLRLDGVESFIACDFELHFDRQRARLLHIKKTDAGRSFQIQTNDIRGQYTRVGMFSIEPVQGGDDLVWFIFAADDSWDGSDVAIDHMFINGNYLGAWTAVNNRAADTPFTFHLSQNYPNPFNGETVIPFSVDRVSRVRMTLYNVLGKKVTCLLDRDCVPGYYEVRWDGRGSKGNIMPSGVYLVEYRSGRRIMVRKIEKLR